MTTAIESTTEFTQAQIAHCETCAFFKGILCGYADKKGYTYTSNRTPDQWSPAFAAGFEIGQGTWTDAECITGTHKVHNRLRHRPPHTEAPGNVAWAMAKAKGYLGDLGDELEGLLNE